jgi:hypothetical protein
VNRAYAPHGIPVHIVGHVCSLCGGASTHKVEEVDTDLPMHPLSAWLCCICFRDAFGLAHDEYPYLQGEAEDE